VLRPPHSLPVKRLPFPLTRLPIHLLQLLLTFRRPNLLALQPTSPRRALLAHQQVNRRGSHLPGLPLPPPLHPHPLRPTNQYRYLQHNRALYLQVSPQRLHPPSPPPLPANCPLLNRPVNQPFYRLRLQAPLQASLHQVDLHHNQHINLLSHLAHHPLPNQQNARAHPLPRSSQQSGPPSRLRHKPMPPKYTTWTSQIFGCGWP